MSVTFIYAGPFAWVESTIMPEEQDKLRRLQCRTPTAYDGTDRVIHRWVFFPKNSRQYNTCIDSDGEEDTWVTWESPEHVLEKFEDDFAEDLHFLRVEAGRHKVHVQIGCFTYEEPTDTDGDLDEEEECDG